MSVLRQLRSTLASQLTMMPPAGQPVYDNLAPKPEWPVRLFLLCGADLLESFAVPNLWQQQDVIIIST